MPDYSGGGIAVRGKVKNSGFFAARLRALRVEAGVSVADLAARSGLNRTYIHNLEAGIRQPTLATAARLAKALGVSLAVFDGIA